MAGALNEWRNLFMITEVPMTIPVVPRGEEEEVVNPVPTSAVIVVVGGRASAFCVVSPLMNVDGSQEAEVKSLASLDPRVETIVNEQSRKVG